jgi:parallel beta-helix repeat protein
VTYATTGINVTYTGNTNNVTIDKCRISNNSSHGIYVYGKSTASYHPTLSNNNIHDNGGTGIWLQNYAKPKITVNRLEENDNGGLYATGSALATVEYNYLRGNYSWGMAFSSNSHAWLHRNTVTANLDVGIDMSSSSNVKAYGVTTDTTKGRNYVYANLGDGIYSVSSSPHFGKDLTAESGNNRIHDNTLNQAVHVSSGQLKAERCYWKDQQGDISGNVDNVPYLTSAPSPVGWGRSTGYDPSTRALGISGTIADESRHEGFFSNELFSQDQATSKDFDPAEWSAQFDAAMKTGFDTGEWAAAAAVITELWRELQDARVPAVDYALLTGYAEQPEVDSAIRKYLALTLVEKSLARQDISTALDDLAKYRQSNPAHDAELLANAGIINLHFKNDLAAAENVLSQLRARAARNDVAAAEQEKILAELIDNYRENFDGVSTTENYRSAQAQMTTDASSLQMDNFPNPFNPETLIRYRISGEGAQEVLLVIFNTVGQQVRKLVATRQNPGEYSVLWDGRNDFGKDAASGMYFLRATVGGKALTRKLMLVR